MSAAQRGLTEETMFDAGRRPMGRLFYCLLAVAMTAFGFRLPAFGAGPVPQSGPATTTVADVGTAPGSVGGIEVRLHDFGWGSANDRNLLGRFNTQAFSLTRLARTQNYFLRLYDGSSPPKYSRYAAALHVDYPL